MGNSCSSDGGSKNMDSSYSNDDASKKTANSGFNYDFLVSPSGDFVLSTNTAYWARMHLTQSTIADVAKKYVDSTDWAVDQRKDNFPSGTPKCNKFVYGVLKEADASPPTKTDSSGTWPIRAGNWTDGTHNSSEWTKMPPGTPWQAGDIIAERRNYKDASGHCAIAVSSTEVIGAGKVVSKGTHDLQNGTVIRYKGTYPGT